MSIKKLTILKYTKQIAIIFGLLAANISLVDAKSQKLTRNNFQNYGTYSGQFMAANLALTTHDYKSAADFLMRLYISEPDDAIVTESLFVVNLINGEFTKARLFAQKYQQEFAGKDEVESSHHYLSKLFLSSHLVKQGDFKTALDRLEKGDDFMISEMSYYLLSTWMNFADEKPLNAVDSLNMLKENSFHRIYYLINSAILAELQDRQKDADIFYNEALLLGGTKLDLVEAYGRFLERTGREKQAFSLYDDFENRAGKHPVVTLARERLIAGEKPTPFIANSQEAIAHSFYQIANIYFGAGNHEESLNYARLAQYLDPDNEYVLNILSLNYQNIGKHLESVKILEQIPSESPFYQKAQIRIAANLEVNGQHDEALAKVAAIQQQLGENDDLNLAYANMLKRNQKYKQAIGYYNKLIESRSLLTINDAHLFYNRAVSRAQLKDWTAAEDDFIQTLKLDPNHSFALNYLGYSWVDMGINLEQGLEMINNALLIEPQNAFIIDSLGWAYYKLGKYDEARIELERAQLVSPSNADISDHLGDVYWKLGRKLEAQFKWQAATIFKSDEINYDDLEYKREHGLDELDKRKAQATSQEAAKDVETTATSG